MPGDVDFEQQVLDVLARWERRLEAASAAWADLDDREQQRREADLDAAGETEEWVLALWNWWTGAPAADQAQLRADVTVLEQALWAAAKDGHLDGPTEEAVSARHLLEALDRIAAIIALD